MPINPDTGAAELMSPGSIGAAQQTDNPAPVYKTAIEYYQHLRELGLGKPAHAVDIPGVTIDPPSPATVGLYWSIEMALYIQVKALVGPINSQNWPDARVNSILSAIAVDYDIWNGDADPGHGHLQELVDKYTKVYRTAVTPV